MVQYFPSSEPAAETARAFPEHVQERRHQNGWHSAAREWEVLMTNSALLVGGVTGRACLGPTSLDSPNFSPHIELRRFPIGWGMCFSPKPKPPHRKTLPIWYGESRLSLPNFQIVRVKLRQNFGYTLPIVGRQRPFGAAQRYGSPVVGTRGTQSRSARPSGRGEPRATSIHQSGYRPAEYQSIW